jgi:probable glucitol transport protein GutA
VFRNTKEVVEVPKQRTLRFTDICKVIFQNKPLLMVLITSLLASISLFIKQSMTIYYTTYVVKDANLSSLLLGIMAICMLVGILIATPISIRLGNKKTTMMIGIGVAALACIGLYFTGPTKIIFIYIWTILAAIFSGLTFVMVWSMIADTIEYAEWKTGFRADGLIYSSASFVQKLATALAGWLAAMLLSVTHYAPNIEQTRQAMAGINLSMTILPGVLLIISLFSLIFYKLDRRGYNQILAEIQVRKTQQ